MRLSIELRVALLGRQLQSCLRLEWRQIVLLLVVGCQVASLLRAAHIHACVLSRVREQASDLLVLRLLLMLLHLDLARLRLGNLAKCLAIIVLELQMRVQLVIERVGMINILEVQLIVVVLIPIRSLGIHIQS